mgnify:FL=1
MGTTTEDILNGEDGHVTWFGKVRGIDTTGTPYGEIWADQDILYVSPTIAGYLTNVKPSAPNAQIFIGVVINAHATTGSYFIRPSWRGNITDLDDVDGTPLTTDGQILVWDNINQYFDPTVNILTIQATANSALQPTGDGSGLTGIVTGELQKITEGTNTGYILKGDNRAGKEDTGANAIDFGFNQDFFPNVGATGQFSFVLGDSNLASGKLARAHGAFSTASADRAVADGSNANAEGIGSRAIGDAVTASGERSTTMGYNIFARSADEYSGGYFGTDYTPSGTNTDRLVNYGNGTAVGSRSDAWTIYKNGAHKFFTATLASVTNAVKGFFMLDENARPNVHDGTQWNALAYSSEVAGSVQKTGETTQSIAGDIVVANNVIGQSFISPLVTIIEDTILTIADSYIIIDALSQPVAAILPVISTVPIGKKYIVVAYDVTNTVTLETSNSEQLRVIKTDTPSSFTLTSGTIYEVINTGTYWQVIDKL